VSDRLDHFISELRTKHHNPKSNQGGKKDILIVGHGDVLRALALRWVNKPLSDHTRAAMPPGSIEILRYDIFVPFSMLFVMTDYLFSYKLS